MLNSKASNVIKFLLPSIDELEFSVMFDSKTGATIINQWDSVLIQPTEQEINDTAITQGFLDYEAENGGDPLKTLRKRAEIDLSGTASDNALLRAVLLILVDEFNIHSLKTNAILDAIDGAANLAGLKSTVGAIADLPNRTGAQLRTATINKLQSGDADT